MNVDSNESEAKLKIVNIINRWILVWLFNIMNYNLNFMKSSTWKYQIYILKIFNK